MKRLVLITGAFFTLSSSTAMAAGQIHLAASDCPPSGKQSFDPADIIAACGNGGSIRLVGSFVPPASIGAFVGIEAIVDLAQSQPSLSDFWQAQPGGCSAGRIAAGFDFAAGPFTCADIFQGRAVGSLVYLYPSPAPGLGSASTRMEISCSMDAANASLIDPTSEYYAFELTIRKNSLPQLCSGCRDPASFYFNDLILEQAPGAPGGSIELTGDGSGQYVSYNGGTAPTPVRRDTWGAIKALYR